MKVKANDVDFDRLGDSGEEKSLDSKVRTSLLRYTVGDARDKHRHLREATTAKIQGLDASSSPRMIRGCQLLYVVEGFYAVRDAKRITFDLSNLATYNWSGDANITQWKTHLDLMVRT